MRWLVLLLAVLLALLTYAAGVQGLAGGLISLLTLGFLCGVPFGIGYATVVAVRPRSRVWCVFIPWLPVLGIVSAVYLTGWEGAVCIAMTLPLLLLGASAGGLAAFRRVGEPRAREVAIVLLLPFALMPLEQRLPASDRVRDQVASITIAAPPARVWDEIAEVDSIGRTELGRPFFTTVGFPAPVAATLDHPQEGGIRVASFERGVRFVETVTEWEPDSVLAFAIDPDKDVPRDALDAHVTIGGPYFDVLSGRYEITAAAGDSVRLTLRSTHRVTTRLNLYAGAWADVVMGSVQRGILAVLKRRAEDPARSAKPRIREATDARRMREVRRELAASSLETGFSITAEYRGWVDVYRDSVVVLVRDGFLLGNRDPGDARLDSVTASLASGNGGRWNPGVPSGAFVVETVVALGDRHGLGPMRRFSIPRSAYDGLEGRWVVFTHHLTVPRTESNPYGWATTYAHDPTGQVRSP